MSQWFSISVIHGLHRVTGHGDLLGIKRCPPPLLSPLVEVTAGAHEAAHHGRDDGHKQEDGGGDASYGGWAELEEHAALLLPLCDHLEGVQATVAPVAVPAAERYERAVKPVMPGSILVHVPEAVLICTDVTSEEEEEQHRGQPHERRAPCRRDHPHPSAIYSGEILQTH